MALFSIPHIPKEKILMVGVVVAIIGMMVLGDKLVQQSKGKAPAIVAGNMVTLRPGGALPPLHQAIRDSQSLSALVDSLKSVPPADIFIKKRAVDELIVSIMFMWAGVDAVDPQRYGDLVDGRVVEFLRANGTLGADIQPDTPVTMSQASDINDMWFDVYGYYAPRLLIQLSGCGVFSGHCRYDYNKDTISIDGGLSPEVIAQIQQGLESGGNSAAIMNAFLGFVDETKGFSNLTDQDQGLIMSLHVDSQ